MATLDVVTVARDPVPVVRVSVTGITADSIVTVTRSPVGGVPGGVVRGTGRVVAAGGAVVVFDTEYPFGQALTYTATVADAITGVVGETHTANAPAVVPDRAGMVLSVPTVNGAADVLATVIDEREHVREWRGARIPIAGVAAPVTVYERHTAPKWTLELGTATRAAYAALGALLEQPAPVFLRVADSACFLTDGYTAVGNIGVNRHAVSAGNTGRHWVLEIWQVSPPPAHVETAVVTLADLHDYEPTDLATLATRAASLLDLTLTVTATAASL